MELGRPLTIAWTLPEPPVRPEGWQRMTSASPQGDDAALEGALAWPAGTLATLRSAFAQRLGRATGWEGDAAAVRAAARVFRRGVACAATAGLAATTQRGGSYAIEFLEGSTPPAPEAGTFVIADGNVARLWEGAWSTAPDLVLTLDEHTKTLDAVARILAAGGGAPRPWTVVGGGLLADVAAFAAGLAGVPIELIPTTLLAMADACVGGKTGVNFPPFGKNQLGLFHFPSRVRVWPGWLRTLPLREVRSGGVECLKHAMLKGDPRLGSRLGDALAHGDAAALAPLLPEIVKVKADVVAADPGEAGQRAVLNLGHTLGHALEGLSQERTSGAVTLLHGEAVAVGIAFALSLSQRVAALAPDAASALTQLLRRAKVLPAAATLAEALGVADLKAPALSADLKRFIGHDKKNLNAGRTSQWVLLDAPGQVARESHMGWTISVFDGELDAAWTAFSSTYR